MEQQKADAAELTMRLSGTEKQRDDALEALVMQQEVADELERERKKNKRELAQLTSTNQNILRQRDEAQRVVIHLRALIEGQAHHMEHLVRSISESEPPSTGDEESQDEEEAAALRHTPTARPSSYASRRVSATSRTSSRSSSRTASRASTVDAKGHDVEDVNPVMEQRFFTSPTSKRFSQMSWSDVADRHVKDKTDAIADIIRNISEQCAAAVEGLHLAQAAAHDDDDPSRYDSDEEGTPDSRRSSKSSNAGSASSASSNRLRPFRTHDSVPPTPELTHRSSTAMSMSSTIAPDRQSLGYQDNDVPTIIEAEDGEDGMEAHEHESQLSTDKDGNKITDGIVNRAGARVSAFGAA